MILKKMMHPTSLPPHSAVNYSDQVQSRLEWYFHNSSGFFFQLPFARTGGVTYLAIFFRFILPLYHSSGTINLFLLLSPSKKTFCLTFCFYSPIWLTLSIRRSLMNFDGRWSMTMNLVFGDGWETDYIFAMIPAVHFLISRWSSLLYK